MTGSTCFKILFRLSAFFWALFIQPSSVFVTLRVLPFLCFGLSILHRSVVFGSKTRILLVAPSEDLVFFSKGSQRGWVKGKGPSSIRRFIANFDCPTGATTESGRKSTRDFRKRPNFKSTPITLIRSEKSLTRD
jgi:hypothetical protein